jgi:hypothetical protein
VAIVSHTSGANSLRLSVSHAVTGQNRLLFVALAMRHDNGMPDTIPAPSSVTYGSAALTRLHRATDGYYQAAEVWVLVAPPLGAQPLTVQFSAGAVPKHAAMGAVSLSGARQTATFGNVAATAGGGTSAALDVPSAGFHAVIDVMSHGTLHTWSPGGNQQELFRDGTDAVHAYSSYTPVVNQVTSLSWGGPTVNYVLLGVPIAQADCP